MRDYKLALVTVVMTMAVGLSYASVYSESRLHDGYWWRSLSKPEDPDPVVNLCNQTIEQWTKLGYVQGFIEGVSTIIENSILFSFFYGDLWGIMAERGKISQELAQLVYVDEPSKWELYNLKFVQLVEGLDEFYKDYRNMAVPIGDAIYVVKWELTGVDEEKIKLYKQYLRVPPERKLEWLRAHWDEWIGVKTEEKKEQSTIESPEDLTLEEKLRLLELKDLIPPKKPTTGQTSESAPEDFKVIQKSGIWVTIQTADGASWECRIVEVTKDRAQIEYRFGPYAIRKRWLKISDIVSIKKGNQ